MEHTVAVATLAFETCALHPRLNSDLLLTAAILHDVGKTHEFQLGAEIALSEAGALVGHVSLGQQLVARARAGDWNASRRPSCTLSLTASWPTTGPMPSPAGSSARRRRWRSTG